MLSGANASELLRDVQVTPAGERHADGMVERLMRAIREHAGAVH